MSTSNPWLWAIPALPFATFLLNGGLYLAACSAYARKHASAGGHGHDHGGHDHAHGDHGHDHAHGGHSHGHDDHAHAHGTPGERVGLPAPVVAAISLIGPVLAFALSVKALLDAHHAAPVGHYFEWIRAGTVSVAFALQVDPLTAVMLMNVAGVGSLIHLYSYGYMKDDIAYPRFMAYLNLFLSAMLILVMADNLPLMFVGWEGVGVCSYLLISFWYHDPPNVDAARKAFVVNRVGDLAFLLGVFGLFSLYGSLDFAGIEAGIGHADLSTVVAHGPLAGRTLGGALAFCAGCLFFGATGKSAQIPLYTWLPDAMAGPTPVSALIHAATMVTAGVYLLGRLDFLYVLLPQVTAVVALVAAATALLSGTIAVAQTDIKKVLAYSTVSQLGFMFCGMASALFVGGLFHVVTHAFFKALLFLGAGAVIHALGGEQDIRKMGGLRKDMPLVAGLFAIGSLALAGVPPFAGFWSKDEVLAGVHLQMSTAGGLWVAVWWMLVLTALLTAFYTTRLVVMVFFGPPADPNRHPHPVHWSMTSVLAVLAVLSAFGGGLAGPLEHFTHPVWAHADIPHEALHASHNIAMAFSMTVVAIGVGSAAFLYGMRPELVTNLVSGPLAGVHRLVENKFLVDELYDAVVVAPTGMLANVLFREIDRKVIDATLVEGPGKAALAVGALLQRTQPGPVAAATAGMSVGAAAVLGYLLWVAYV